ncbi:hypothetical protein JCM19233_3551 [Vibrio astriarenae]|nr:hypothetical protein JCM19233_3551 [Vibrio sp. C7]
MRFNTVATAIAVTMLSHELTFEEWCTIADQSSTKDVIYLLHSTTGYATKHKPKGIATDLYRPSPAFMLQVKRAFKANNGNGVAAYDQVMSELTA